MQLLTGPIVEHAASQSGIVLKGQYKHVEMGSEHKHWVFGSPEFMEMLEGHSSPFVFLVSEEGGRIPGVGWLVRPPILATSHQPLVATCTSIRVCVCVCV